MVEVLGAGLSLHKLIVLLGRMIVNGLDDATAESHECRGVIVRLACFNQSALWTVTASSAPAPLHRARRRGADYLDGTFPGLLVPYHAIYIGNPSGASVWLAPATEMVQGRDQDCAASTGQSLVDGKGSAQPKGSHCLGRQNGTNGGFEKPSLTIPFRHPNLCAGAQTSNEFHSFRPAHQQGCR